MEQRSRYETLEAAQKGDLDVTLRLRWFLRVIDGALNDADIRLEAVLRRGRFWTATAVEGVNGCQRKILNPLLDGFQGKFTSSK